MIRVGVAGWSYPDWRGIVYPEPRPRGFDELRYLASTFDTLEVNSSFYRPVPQAMAERWVERVADRPGFRFTAKLYRGLTHEAQPSAAAFRDIVGQVREGLAPLQDAGRLGALLCQFPYSFRRAPEALDRLERIAEAFQGLQLVLEVRHGSWLDPATLDWLSGRAIGFCNVDQPRIGQSISGTSIQCAETGYVRLHGRNYREWFRSARPAKDEASSHAGRDARYNYLYEARELEPWIDRIRSVASRARETYVIANNHFEGKAACNALELKAMLEGAPVDVPPPLCARYPRLQSIAKPPSAPEQRRLF